MVVGIQICLQHIQEFGQMLKFLGLSNTQPLIDCFFPYFLMVTYFSKIPKNTKKNTQPLMFDMLKYMLYNTYTQSRTFLILI